MRPSIVLALCLTVAGLAPSYGNAPDVPWLKALPVSPSPVTPPTPGTVPLLTEDLWYVREATEPVLAIGSPPTLLSVTVHKGPLYMLGKFYGGTGKPESKLFSAPQVIVVQATGNVNGRGELVVFLKGDGGKDADRVFRQLIDANTAPQPPPKPDPDPPPGPGPSPVPPKPDPVPPSPSASPIPHLGNRVLFVVERKDISELPPAQQQIFYSRAVGSVWEYLEAKCVTEADGTKGWRAWDQHIVTKAADPIWREAMKRPRTSLPWIVISNGRTGYEGPLPKDSADTLTLLRKYFESPVGGSEHTQSRSTQR